MTAFRPCGLDVNAWAAAFMGCHNAVGGFGVSWVQWCWPDGGAFIDQPQHLVEVFGILRSAALEAANKKD